MTGLKPPLVLLHPFTSSGRVWDDLVPLLSDYHQVHTPTAIGHRGGSEPQRRPATIADLYDDAERWLDEHGLDRPHLVGTTIQPVEHQVRAAKQLRQPIPIT
ncbi:alpha/beta fold hydrolase [Mycobacterium sp.]|uniref:alpha/beta fold hydrolase n=1 Tax=Mycobacterium sp. TaxID=1785 RepID=UPI003BB2190F